MSSEVIANVCHDVNISARLARLYICKYLGHNRVTNSGPLIFEKVCSCDERFLY